jgi:hypothetical protein
MAGALYVVIGLVAGVVVSIASLAGALAADGSEAQPLIGLIGVGAIFILPICYGALGFVASLVAAWLYNMFAGFVGGVEIDVQ